MRKLMLLLIFFSLLGIPFLQTFSAAKPPPPPFAPPPPVPPLVRPFPPPPPGHPPVPPPARLLLPAPVIVAPPVVITGNVSITVNALNVRSGPGVRYPVIGIAYGGTVVGIYGRAPGWLYVMYLDGHYGWVSEAYTTIVP